MVSDVVESQSGYLDIGFDVPYGGAFRVIDVIVAEAPRFVPDYNRTVAISDTRRPREYQAKP